MPPGQFDDDTGTIAQDSLTGILQHVLKNVSQARQAIQQMRHKLGLPTEAEQPPNAKIARDTVFDFARILRNETSELAGTISIISDQI